MFDFNSLFSRQNQRSIWNLNIKVLGTWDFSNLEYVFWSPFEFQIIKTDIARIYIIYWRKKLVLNNNRKELIVFTERDRDFASFYITLQFLICFDVYWKTYEHIQILQVLVSIFNRAQMYLASRFETNKITRNVCHDLLWNTFWYFAILLAFWFIGLLLLGYK